MNKQAIKREIAGMSREELNRQLEIAMTALENAGAELTRVSAKAQEEAAAALVQNYTDEAKELQHLEQEMDAEDTADQAAEEAEKAGKLPE